MSPPGIEPGLPQPQCGVIATIRRRQDMTIQKKNSYHNNIIKKNLVLVSSYKNCFNINSNFIRIKYKYHYFNRNCPITMSVRGEHGVVKLIK